ncbi:MAG: nucleotidyl transferase AbiEii/AbiGii toxin family protein [Actinobacteria bacterium]|nr:nucleotidyl transferase AbiEii/AbiGii toxin family protein [Actinomycetota bacterium]
MSADRRVPYAAAADFERAIGDLIAQAAASAPYGVSDLRRQFAYGRLLARVFTHQPDLWVLKGAAGLLTRIPGRARHSLDIDLWFGGRVEAALDALREAAALDLGDFFTFDIERGPVLTGTEGTRLRVIAYLGDKVFERFRVDVVVASTMTGAPEPTPPLEPVRIPGLRSVDYRTHPMADQIADKVSAFTGTYAGLPSSRYRDLVDLVLIATTQAVDAGALHAALFAGTRQRRLDPNVRLALPSPDWPEGYRRIAAQVPGLVYQDAAAALQVVGHLIEPVLAGLKDAAWDPARLEWKPAPPAGSPGR